MTLSYVLLALLLVIVCFACDEPNPNCGYTYAGLYQANCETVDCGYPNCANTSIGISNGNCSSACSYLWSIASKCSNIPSGVIASTVCNVFGCNCDNCALNDVGVTIDTSKDEPPSYPGLKGCTMTCFCTCGTGPIQNAGQQVVTDAITYLNSTVIGRRRIVSSKFCSSGQQVSLDFLLHLEALADTNNDGRLTAEEFDAARDASKVTVPLGCDAPSAQRLFPNIAPCGRLRHAKKK